jgi:hypothetical protein
LKSIVPWLRGQKIIEFIGPKGSELELPVMVEAMRQ